ncbi:MAG: DUF7544 domain-containing protein [Planctomycetota bacterium]
MNISITRPIGDAIEWTKKVLFNPFELKKWLVLGFCYFLASLGHATGCGPQANFSHVSSSGNEASNIMHEVWDWVSSQPTTAVLLIGSILLIFMCIILLLQWLSSRGVFMLLDGVLRNEGAVVEPWKEFKSDGNSVFIFRIFLLIFGTAGSLIIVAAGALLAWPEISAGVFQTRALMATIAGIALLIPFGILIGLARAILIDFAVPVMYRHRIPATEAMFMVWKELIAPHCVTFLLFYAMKFVLGIGAAFIAGVVTCLTCCVAALPYLSSVILLPLAVFFRSYSVFFLAQFGDKWQVVPLDSDEA